MNIPRQDKLRTRLIESGWEIMSQPYEGLEWYADEQWKIKSLWSPVGLELYLTFLIDPMIDGNRKDGEGVWAVGASLSPPQSRKEAEGPPLVVLNKNWNQSIGDFVNKLDNIRDDWKAHNA